VAVVGAGGVPSSVVKVGAAAFGCRLPTGGTFAPPPRPPNPPPPPTLMTGAWLK
jgi:hypothetical protein